MSGYFGPQSGQYLGTQSGQGQANQKPYGGPIEDFLNSPQGQEQANQNPYAPTGSATPGMPGFHFNDDGSVTKDAPSAQNAANALKKSAGQAPDFAGAMQQTADASRQAVNQQTQQNRANTQDPFSSQTWTTDASGRPMLSQGLAGGLGTGAQALEGQAGAALGQGLNPNLFAPVGNGDAARNQAINAAWGQATSRLDPQWAEASQQQISQLANQGLDPNSQAYRNSMQQFGNSRNDAYNQALYSAIGQGTQAGSTALQGNIAAQQSNIAAALQQRNAPLEELQTLQGFSNQQPQYNAAAMAATPDYEGAATQLGQYNLSNSGQAQQLTGEAISAVGQIAGGAAGIASKCDERAKVDILRLPLEAEPGVPYAVFAYKDAPHKRFLGVIAQDLEKVAPERVFVGPDGFKYVMGAPFVELSEGGTHGKPDADT